MFAAQSGHERCFRALIEKSAHKHAKTKDGHTALDIARAHGHTLICKLLTWYMHE